jgi:hypothetical protein
MPTVKNMLYSTISLDLPEGRSLTLGPRESKDIPVSDLASDDLRRRILEEELYILPPQSAEPAPPPPPPPAQPKPEKPQN